MVFLAASVAVPPSLGQVTPTGALLQGTVQDPSGASVAGASVRIVNDATGIAETTATDQTGQYVFGDLRPGTYTMAVSLPSFKTVIRPKVVLQTRQQTSTDFTLDNDGDTD